MQLLDNNTQAFLALVRAGLWEQDVQLLQYDSFDYSAIYRLAEEQSVVGLVAAGLEHIIDKKVPKEVALTFAGATLQLEQHNAAMNQFIGVLAEKMRTNNIIALLVKGQGIAQCYERPLWRACGDVDLFLDNTNYNKAKSFLLPLASSIEEETLSNMHLGLVIESWVVELHGTLRGEVLNKIDNVNDQVQKDTFVNANTRVWRNGNVDVLLPAPDNDVVFVFTHILQHFFKSGIGLRQICDLCRLLWTYRDTIDGKLLEERLESMGMMTEWKAFAALAVNTLGMPKDAMPLYSTSLRWRKKANRIIRVILQTGNFGHNNDRAYYSKYPYLIRKVVSLWEHVKDGYRHVFIFPLDTTMVWVKVLKDGIMAVLKGK